MGRERWRSRAAEGESAPVMWCLLNKLLFTTVTERLFTNSVLLPSLLRLRVHYPPLFLCFRIICLMLFEGQAGRRIMTGNGVIKCSYDLPYNDVLNLHDVVWRDLYCTEARDNEGSLHRSPKPSSYGYQRKYYTYKRFTPSTLCPWGAREFVRTEIVVHLGFFFF